MNKLENYAAEYAAARLKFFMTSTAAEAVALAIASGLSAEELAKALTERIVELDKTLRGNDAGN